MVGAVAHVRAQGGFPFFKIVLITNSTGLHLPQVQAGLKLFTARDEIWAKLDAGSAGYLAEINRPKPVLPGGLEVSLDHILSNILALGRQRPVVIQSLFSLVGGKEPPAVEIEAYTQRLRELKERGAQISLVQIYSAHRPAMHPECRHLPLRTLSQIAQRVRETTGLEAEVF